MKVLTNSQLQDERRLNIPLLKDRIHLDFHMTKINFSKNWLLMKVDLGTFQQWTKHLKELLECIMKVYLSDKVMSPWIMPVHDLE